MFVIYTREDMISRCIIALVPRNCAVLELLGSEVPLTVLLNNV